MTTSKTVVAPATKNSVTPTTEKADSKIVSLKPEQKPDPASLEGRLLRLNQLVELRGKYDRLRLSEQKLSTFVIAKGEENVTLTIEDENIREEFSTSNPAVIKEVLDFLRTTIQNKRKEIEPQLTW